MVDTKTCLDEVMVEIRRDAAPKFIADDTEEALRDALRGDFERELKRDNWAVEGPVVRQRALEAGAGAKALAGMNRAVSLDNLLRAIRGLGCNAPALAGDPPPRPEQGRYCLGILSPR
jgi:hypothetical protein